MDIKHDLELDLIKSQYIFNKCRNDLYAQHLYAAMCNNWFIKGNDRWMTTWRGAGGIVADLRNCGEEYLDWYCSGMSKDQKCMREGCVSDEIRKDLLALGWTIEPYDCAEDVL